MTYRPRNRIVEFADPVGTLVSLADLKSHCRVFHDDEDADVVAYERAAVQRIEKETQRLLIRRAATLRLPGLPALRTPIELPGGIVSEVTSVTAGGDAVTGARAYGHSPAVLVPGADWPTIDAEGYPVVIEYTTGFDTVPDPLVQAVKILAAEMFANREDSIVGQSVAQFPMGLEYLVAPYRIRPA